LSFKILIHVDFNLYEFYTVKCISWKIKVKEGDVRATQRDVHLVSIRLFRANHFENLVGLD